MFSPTSYKSLSSIFSFISFITCPAKNAGKSATVTVFGLPVALTTKSHYRNCLNLNADEIFLQMSFYVS